jgi:alkylation response protein AidB-like acyl-CoA dehydrogenase
MATSDFDQDFRDQLRATARQVLEREAPLDPLAGPPQDAGRAWRIGADLGWPGVEIPEEYGGLGGSFRELGVLLHEIGRAAAGGPLFSSAVLAAGGVALGTAELRRRLLPRLADGSVIGTAALLGASGVPGRIEVAATPTDGGWSLTGTASFVSDLLLADIVVVAAISPQGTILLFLLDPDTDGVTAAATPAYDPTRAFGALSLLNVRLAADALLVEPDLGAAAYFYLLRRAAITISADCVGGAERILEITLAYMRERHQFGRPIGAFQALKHRAADVAMAIETARGAVEYATGTTKLSALMAAAAIAKAQAADAYALAAAEAVSLHGGIGYTLEHPAHVYLKRAKFNQLWFGSSEWHLEQLATLALTDPHPKSDGGRPPVTTVRSGG